MMTNSLLEKAQARLLAGRLVAAGSRGVVAVSGGRDSMVLLHVLEWLGRAAGWRLIVASLDHGLRGAEGARDLAFVRSGAEDLALQFVGGTTDIEASRRAGESTETAARRARHAFLVEVAHDHGAEWIATGHHAGDQTELFLMRLLRGAGARGLAGMSFSDPSPADPEIRIVRPLLEYRPSEIATLAADWKIPFRSDASNDDRRFFRNRVRHELIPFLQERFQPALDAVLAREQIVLRDQAEWIEAEAERWLREKSEGTATAFGQLPVALQREVLRVQAVSIEVGLEFADVEHLRRSESAPLPIGAERFLVRQADGTLRITERESGFGRFSGGFQDVVLDGAEGALEYGGGRLQWEVVSGSAWSREAGVEAFDADRLGSRVRLRFWTPGDRFHPIGAPVPVRLQDLFTHARVPPRERRRRLMAEDVAGRLFWVEGLRIGDIAKVTPTTRRILRWSWRRDG